MNDLEKVLTKELNKLIKTESIGRYHSFGDIYQINRALCILKVVITLLLATVAVYAVMNMPPILTMIGLFPYDMGFVVFAKIMEYTLVFCVTSVILYLSRKTCHDNVEIETKILYNSFVTPPPALMDAYRDARKQMINTGVICDDWDNKKLVSLGEIFEFIQQYKKI